MLEQAAEAEDAHVVITDEIRGDLERIPLPVVDPMTDTGGVAAIGEQAMRGGDVGRNPFVPRPSQLCGHRLDAHTHWLRPRPIEPRGVGDGQSQELGAVGVGDVECVGCHRCGGAARAEPDENAFDHGTNSRGSERRRADRT